ncbi:MAG: response regulator [Deltaproteobacteria bacterium]|nr:response regulator [Deltaproteobacteria bacterium]
MSSHETNVRRLARVLSEISHRLETSDGCERRVARVLTLTREIVPSRRCALLEVHDDGVSLHVSPAESPDERATLTRRLTSLYRLVAGGDEIGRSPEPKPSLALPLMGLDNVIGVIRVEPDEQPYDATHLRLLSVVAAQLGAYLAMVRLRERDLARTREIEAAHDFQRVLAGVVGHDLRSPLSVITLVASSLLETATDARHVRSLERALRSAEQATRLMTDLVDVTESRVTGSIRVAPEAADFRAVVERSVDDLRQTHSTRTIELHVPATAVPGRFDPTRVGQIITNLVNNAVTHGDARSPIEVTVTEDAEHIVIAVRNHGTPIPVALVPTIFDPFKQGAPASGLITRGLGLGLYIVDRLTRGHGGSVAVTSDAEATVFTARIPRFATTPGAREATAGAERPLVLVVDDDDDVRIGVSGILEQRGYLVATACDGRDALAQLRAGLRPRMILLDLSMPIMNGEEFCAECSNDPQLAAIPIVVVSADTAAAVKLAQTSGRSLLTKPVRVEQLLATLESIH